MKQNIQGQFNIGDAVRIITGPYNNESGIIERLGSAAEVIYYHVKLVNYATVMTFTIQQIEGKK